MTRFQRQRKRLLTTIAVLSAILMCLSGVAYAKYATTKSAGFGSIQITADIGSVKIVEKKVSYDPKTGYSQATDYTDVSGTTEYAIIPGYDIPMEASVSVSKPNKMEVYIYLIVDAALPAGISYELADHWEVVGVYGNKRVYSYGTDPVNAQTGGPWNIPILVNNTICVSQYVNQGIAGSVYLNFSAVMYQAAAGQTPAEVYAYYNP